jgi:hypothetical protein
MRYIIPASSAKEFQVGRLPLSYLADHYHVPAISLPKHGYLLRRKFPAGIDDAASMALESRPQSRDPTESSVSYMPAASYSSSFPPTCPPLLEAGNVGNFLDTAPLDWMLSRSNRSSTAPRSGSVDPSGRWSSSVPALPPPPWDGPCFHTSRRKPASFFAACRQRVMGTFDQSMPHSRWWL